MDVGTAIRARRDARGWSQERLATDAGLHRVTVVNIESGRATPSLSTLQALAAALGCEPGDLLAEPELPATGTEGAL